MELKDFARIHLQPGESKTVSFEMTPYDISLLNDRMDRVVEKESSNHGRRNESRLRS